MNLVDVNVLLYAYFPRYPRHERARAWLEEQLNGASVALPWATLLGFTRIGSNPRIIEGAPTAEELWELVGRWLALPGVWCPAPTERHHELVRELLAVDRRSEAVPDAHLAALAIEHGLVLCSADQGFGRLPLVRWDDPTA